jgi:hypothetical protein
MPLINGYEGERLQSNTLMSSVTGRDIEDMEHLKRCIVDILTTPKGSRVMRRNYGSDLFRLLDRNITKELIVQIYAEIATAIALWEPRLHITRVTIDATLWAEGKMAIDLYGYYYLEGKPVRLQNLFLDFFKSQQLRNT